MAMPAAGMGGTVLLPLAHLLHCAVGALAAMAFLGLLLLLLDVAVLGRLPVFGLELLLLLGHHIPLLRARNDQRGPARPL